MIEITLLSYLKNELNVPCYLEVQETMPKEYVLIERTSGSKNGKLDTAMIAVQSYSTSLYKSATLNELVKDAMLKITNTCDIGACKLNSDYNYTDASTKQYRYQAVFDLVY